MLKKIRGSNIIILALKIIIIQWIRILDSRVLGGDAVNSPELMRSWASTAFILTLKFVQMKILSNGLPFATAKLSAKEKEALRLLKRLSVLN